MSTALAVSSVAAGLTALGWAPQLSRAFRTTEGLSVSAWLQGFALGSFWGPTGWSPARGCWWPVRAPSRSAA